MGKIKLEKLEIISVLIADDTPFNIEALSIYLAESAKNLNIEIDIQSAFNGEVAIKNYVLNK